MLSELNTALKTVLPSGSCRVATGRVGGVPMGTGMLRWTVGCGDGDFTASGVLPGLPPVSAMARPATTSTATPTPAATSTRRLGPDRPRSRVGRWPEPGSGWYPCSYLGPGSGWYLWGGSGTGRPESVVGSAGTTEPPLAMRSVRRYHGPSSPLPEAGRSGLANGATGASVRGLVVALAV